MQHKRKCQLNLRIWRWHVLQDRPLVKVQPRTVTFSAISNQPPITPGPSKEGCYQTLQARQLSPVIKNGRAHMDSPQWPSPDMHCRAACLGQSKQSLAPPTRQPPSPQSPKVHQPAAPAHGSADASHLSPLGHHLGNSTSGTAKQDIPPVRMSCRVKSVHTLQILGNASNSDQHKFSLPFPYTSS